MVWTRRLTRTAVIFLVMITVLADQSDAEIRVEWSHIDGTAAMGLGVIETDGRRLYAGAADGVYSSLDHGHTWRSSDLPDYVNTIAITQKPRVRRNVVQRRVSIRQSRKHMATQKQWDPLGRTGWRRTRPPNH